ncbi:ferritin-like domain-containing protein [Solirubrum puertoriconensis]|uniref:Dessication-associated protein n=1 Tax=Solirubrum puertoriconensis TaxID=1751427 RepID=A0A9X0HIP8_SOLP1|nr:ferritin-like domain-containing protein [Solirubrum puertoriconensis]KUG06595.1 hypothetical protein ASU33_04425 [Solirubrum puertoriconensis]
MNLFKILSDLEQVDPEVMGRLNSRRDAFASLGNMAKKFALASAPIAIGSVFNKALAQSGSSVTDVLNYALLLERLEEAFYVQALAAPTLAVNLSSGSAARNAIQKIKDNETAHVQLLASALGSAAAPAPRSFDFGNAFATYNSFLTFAQAFEDLGVRAYKGQAGALKGAPNNVLQTALQIHSVEARHAAHIRMMRRAAAGGGAQQFGWITNKEANGAPDAIYGGGNPVADHPAEDNVSQAGVNLTTLGYTAAEVSEAFDEPLDRGTVTTLATPYVRA